jgi:hypothetical protein
MRLELLGVEIAVEGNAGAEVVRALAALAAPGEPSPRPDLVLAASAVQVPQAVPDPTVFVHFPLRAGRRGGTLVIGDAAAVFVVSADGRRIDAELTPRALAEGAPEIAALHLPVALAFALRHHGVFHLHAAALADGGRALLVPGQSGVGKTTLALALLEAGLAWLGDDSAFVAVRDGAPCAEGVARPFHLRPDTAGAFGRAAARAAPPDASGRRELDPEAAWPGRARRGPLRPGTLLFPEVARRPTTAVEPLAPAEALGRLVEASALVVVDGAARAPEHLALLGRIASEARALRVELGEDLLRAPEEVARRILALAGAP